MLGLGAHPARCGDELGAAVSRCAGGPLIVGVARIRVAGRFLFGVASEAEIEDRKERKNAVGVEIERADLQAAKVVRFVDQ